MFTDLGGLPGSSNLPVSSGYAINNAGMIVGQSKWQAMVYENGVMSGLHINDRGQIVGEATWPTPRGKWVSACLLTPVTPNQ